jgi:hypothetical protein
LDWAKHPIAVHSDVDDTEEYHLLLGDPRFEATSFQYSTEETANHVQAWRMMSAAAGRPWVLDMDENFEHLTDTNANPLRKRILYRVYFNGGNIEWYLGYYENPIGGDDNLEDFRTREAMWNFTWYARHFMEQNLPFWEMDTQDDLLIGEGLAFGEGHVFVKPGEIYAVHIPQGDPDAVMNLSGIPGLFEMRWYDPREGVFIGQPAYIWGGTPVSLWPPPYNETGDWVVLFKKTTNSNYAGEGEEMSSYLPFISRACH